MENEVGNDEDTTLKALLIFRIDQSTYRLPEK